MRLFPEMEHSDHSGLPQPNCGRLAGCPNSDAIPQASSRGRISRPRSAAGVLDCDGQEPLDQIAENDLAGDRLRRFTTLARSSCALCRPDASRGWTGPTTRGVALHVWKNATSSGIAGDTSV